jgi:hypothetical protein
VFRRHKGLTLFLPGSAWLALLVLVCATAFYLAQYSKWALWLLTLTAIPLFKLLQLYLAWLSYSVVFVPGDQAITECSGLVGAFERRIPLSDFNTIECERPWWARLLHIDVGDATLGVIGGPFALQRMGNLRELWALLESRGQSYVVQSQQAPPRPPYPASKSTALAPVAVKVARPRRTNGGQMHTAPPRMIAPVDSYSYEGNAFSPSAISYAGFCAFCQQFILMDGDWASEHYRARNPSRRYYCEGISESIAGSYLLALKAACILIPGSNGHARGRLSSRIRSIEDIQEIVPDISTLLAAYMPFHTEVVS